MKKRELKDCNPYNPPKHFNVTALSLQSKEESGCEKFWMGLSHFLPDGGCDYDESQTEKIYFVVKGEITVCDKDKKKYILKENDSIHISPGEGRSLKNETNLPVTMLVVMSYPDS